jgi:DtxR family Mn-dependent transcriptional regulator
MHFTSTLPPILHIIFRFDTEDSTNQYYERKFIATDMTGSREGSAMGDLTVETAIVIIVFFSSISLLLLCSRKGFVRSWRTHRQSDRIAVEDAVKHLYGLGASKDPVSLNDLASALGVSLPEAESLAGRLVRNNWASRSGRHLELTNIGERKALAMIRSHRIVESHLARQGTPIEDIHEQADRDEHFITLESVDAMESELGYPRQDPHGDIIPNSLGEFSGEEGVPLIQWPLGREARIVHVEDEPKPLFVQLVAMGLATGAKIRIIKREENRILVHSQHLQHILSPLTAGRIMVVDAPPQSVPLGELSAGEHGIVDEIDESGKTLRRLLDIGVVPGSDIEVIRTAPLGDPIELRVRGALITLRQHEANRIWVRKVERASL